MSKMLKITRGEIDRYEDLFRQIATVSRGETEDHELYMKFKHAVGKNLKKLELANKLLVNEIGLIATQQPEYQTFLCACEEIADKWADKDEKGNVILVPDKDDPKHQRRQFSPENQKASDDEIGTLKKIYADAIRHHENQTAKALALLDEYVEIELLSVPFEWVAERIAEAWLDAITCMVDDLPECN
jgi:hypothetical protein